MTSQASSRRSSGSSTSASGSADSSTCRDHDRRICPPCLFNCQKVDLDLSTSPLDVADGLQVYMAYPHRLLFTWSEQHEDLKKLDALADISQNSEYDDYTIVENAGWYPLFIPQWDEQVRGAGIWDRFREFRFMQFKTPVPDSPDKFDTVWCETCQLTWLKGETNNRGVSFHAHPRHQTLPTLVAAERYLDVRSLIVRVDGVLPNRYPAGPVNAGMGVFFGKGSKYNHSEPFYMESGSKQRAVFYSAQRAMEIVRDTVIPEWLGHLKEAKEDGGINHIRLIIATNSEDVTDTFAKRINRWQWDRVNHQYRRPGKGKGAGDFVKNSDIIRNVHRQIEDFKRSDVGVETLWYHVGKQYNDEAKALASTSAGKPVLP
ncbi:hypothetical protein F4818DRAFT_402348 [Hypoxylon cercidicola]|nr:hypothetical protein F4818DRAFT_402348 [Hypoxylon cercidicola]